jgi:hypothetical protein
VKTRPATEPIKGGAKRWPKHAVWAGMVITLAGGLSYFLHFAQYPDLRDFPLLNLPLVLLGLILAAAGCWQVFRQRGGALGKTLATAGLLLTLGFAGLFSFYVFFFSYQLPEAASAPATQAMAPDFTLLDPKGQPVSLADFRGKKVVLVFYRGHW